MDLDDFAKTYNPHAAKNQWCESLPEEIQSQILESKAAHTAVVEWLIQMGYVDATGSKVSYFRKTHR